MKKTLVILVALLSLIPASIFAFMSMDDEELSEVTAQNGLNIAMALQPSATSIIYIDPGGAAGVSNTGAITFNTPSITQNGSGITFTAAAPLRVDAGGNGTSTWLYFTFPTFSDYELSIPNILISSGTFTLSKDLGSFNIDNVSSDNTAIAIMGLSSGIEWSMGTHITSGLMAWGDSDGYGGTYTTRGYLKFDGITVDDNSGGWGYIKWDINTGSDGTTPYISMEGGPNSGLYMRSSAVRLSNVLTTGTGTSLFGLTLGNLSRTQNWQIWATPHLNASTSIYGGLDVSAKIHLSNGFLEMSDSDGFTSYTTAGYYTFAGATMNDGSGGAGTLLNATWFGVGNDGSTDAWMVIRQDTALTLGRINFDSVYIQDTTGASGATTERLGSLGLNDLTFSFIDYSIRGEGTGQGYFVDSSWQVTDGDLVYGDHDGYGGTYTTMGYYAATNMTLSDTNNGTYYVGTFDMQSGTDTTGNSRLQVTFVPNENIALSFRPSVSTSMPTTGSDKMGTFRVTGTISGTFQVYAH